MDQRYGAVNTVVLSDRPALTGRMTARARTKLRRQAQAGQPAVLSDLDSGYREAEQDLPRPVIALRSGARLTIPIATDGTPSRADAAGIPAEFELARATVVVVAATVIASVVFHHRR